MITEKVLIFYVKLDKGENNWVPYYDLDSSWG